MLFPTLDFLLFFLVVAFVTACLSKNFSAKKLFLVATSYVFYGFWDWRFCFLLALSSLISWGGGLLIDAARDRHWRQRILALALTLHLGILGTFKYLGFFIDSTNDVARSLGLGHELPLVQIMLPVGISFFTFHGISYLVDLYRGDIAVCRSLSDMLLYISFFPQLVAGPIVRAAYFLPQLERPAPAGSIPLAPALILIVLGLFKKIVVANYLAVDLVDPVFFDPARFGAIDRVAAAWGYAVQIYCDFSAYTDIAIGLAALLGFRFPRNFDQPYRAARLAEFWRRWHITLSNWLRDYLYVPLGGNRRGAGWTYVNLMLTMLIGGIWHGAAWKFVFWGVLHGGGLACERLARPLIGETPKSSIGQVVSTVLVFHFVCLAWIFFRADGVDTAWSFLTAPADTPPSQIGPLTLALLTGGLATQFLPPDLIERAGRALSLWPVWAQGAAAGFGAALADALGPDGVAPFIYFQF